jgi:hypothetical protein
MNWDNFIKHYIEPELKNNQQVENLKSSLENHYWLNHKHTILRKYGQFTPTIFNKNLVTCPESLYSEQ